MARETGPWRERLPDWVPSVPHESLKEWFATLKIDRGTLTRDAVAGIPGAVGSVPDGMAAGVLAGTNPVFGLYASVVGPIVGGLLSSSALMVVTTTSAAALAAGSAISVVAPAKREGTLFLLVIVSGILMLIAGIARLGRYTRFVSQSVMLGFLSGVAVNVICSQLPDLTGVPAVGAHPYEKALNVFRNLGDVHWRTLAVGVASIVILVLFARTKFSQYAALVAIVLPSLVVAVAGMSVTTVGDNGAIPQGLPLPQLPKLSYLTPDVIFSAFAIAVIVLVQGVGVGETVRLPGRPRPDVDRDFVAEGASNIVSGLFQGMPVGGSVSQSALNQAAGARSRWAAIFSGLWLALVVIAFSGVVAKVAVASLAGLLIVAAVRAIRVNEIRATWSVSRSSTISMVVTFLCTLSLPIAAAVGAGVIVSLLLQLNQEALDLRMVELTEIDGRLVESEPPRNLPSDTVTVLDVYGSLFYAGSKTLQARLPRPESAERAVVILRLRGRGFPPTTFFFVIGAYAKAISDRGGKLYLSGVDAKLAPRYREVNESQLLGAFEVVEATNTVGESTRQALSFGESWLLQERQKDA